MNPSRRQWIKAAGGTSLLLGWDSRCVVAQSEPAVPSKPHHVPVRVVTSGPRHHWFGYYDKLQFDPTQRFLLGMQVEFEHRSPTPQDCIRIGMVDLADNDRWMDLGQSTAWGWQQGCMLQWLPGSRSQVLWNDRSSDGESYVCRVLDIETGDQKTIPAPIYSVSPDGRTAVTTDFRRINDVRPGYGYGGLPDPHAAELAPREAGIDAIDLQTGKVKQIISLAQIAELGEIPDPDPQVKHYFNHLLFNTDGSRFVFLHRWRYPNGSRKTRMLTANPDGSDIRVIDDNGMTSHFIWRDPQHLLAWSRQESHGDAFYLFEDRPQGTIEVVGKEAMPRDGHCTYLPNRDWIVNDTYPDRDRYQTVYLYHVPSQRRIEIGRFFLPKPYTGEWRCDTHPRHSPDGSMLVIDAPTAEHGRQLHLLDIREIVGRVG